MIIQQDTTGFFIEDEVVLCRPIDLSLYKLEEEVNIKLDKENAWVIDAKDLDSDKSYKEKWKVVYKLNPITLSEEPFKFHHPVHYIDTWYWYVLIMFFLSMFGFDLGIIIALIWLAMG